MREIDEMDSVVCECHEAIRAMKVEYENYRKQKEERLYMSYYNRLLLAFQKTERACLMMRRLMFESVRDGQQKYEMRQQLLVGHGAQICKNEYGYEIHLPMLLPHRKKGQVFFIDDILMHTLKDYEERHGHMDKWEEAVICFRHCYDKKKKVGMIRDHDYIEKKRILDILRLYFLETDNGLYLHTFDCSELGEKDETIIYIMEKSSFSDWIVSGKA